MIQSFRHVWQAAVLLCFFVCFSGLRAQDPAAPGPLVVSVREYALGDTAFVPDNFPTPVELTGRVFYPTELARAYPVVIFMHGRHSTTYDPATNQAFLEWPPSAGRLSIPSYRGYDYAANLLASDGYIVISVSANGINANDNNAAVNDRGATARASLIQKHLDLWKTWTTVGGGPFGTQFVGRLDLTNIGTMGHSRGGEGVTTHFNYNKARGAPYGIHAVLPIAPVDYNRYIVNNVPLGVILPYCDGDVSDLQGAHFFDDARYNIPGDPTPKYFWTVMGGNHNFFNTVWTPGQFTAGAADDWLAQTNGAIDPFAGPTQPRNGRLTYTQQQGVGAAFMTAFFRIYLGSETQFLAFLKGDAPPPPSALTNALFMTYHAPDLPTQRRDVNRFLGVANLSVNTLGGRVSSVGLAPFEVAGGPFASPSNPLPGQPAARQPHNTPALYFPDLPGLSQLKVGWDSPQAALQNDLPPGQRDVSGFAMLSFRAALNFTDYRNTLRQDDFSVVLTDGAGRTAATTVSQWSKALAYPPGKISRLPKVVLNGVRIPLSAFSGADLTDIRSVRFIFDRQPQGAVIVSDIAFADPAR